MPLYISDNQIHLHHENKNLIFTKKVYGIHKNDPILNFFTKRKAYLKTVLKF